MSFPPKPDDTRPFLVDVSSHQGIIDWEKMLTHIDPVVRGVAIRAGICWGYTDKWFAQNWKEAHSVGFSRTSYHVLYPLEPIDKQMTHWFNIMGDDLGEAAPVLDVELIHNASRKQITDAAWASCQWVETRTDKYPMIYSRPYFVRDSMQKADWFGEVDWWMALYAKTCEHNGTGLKEMCAAAGVPFERVRIQQTGDKGIGAPFGCQSLNLDFDRWLGTEEELAEFFGEATVQPVIPTYQINKPANVGDFNISIIEV